MSVPHLTSFASIFSYLLPSYASQEKCNKKVNAFMHSSIFFFLDFLKKKEERKNSDKFHRIGFPGRIRIRIASPDANILHSADSCTCTYM